MQLTGDILRELCKVFANILTHEKIDTYLAECKIENVSMGESKERKLYSAFTNVQKICKSANAILNFAKYTISPVRYGTDKSKFTQDKDAINKVLLYAGLELGDNGEFLKVKRADSISEIQKRVRSFQSKLELRDVHPKIIFYCRQELIEENYFHSVLEASKSVFDHIRELSGCNEDGAELIEKVFNSKNPILVFNKLETESERSEHKGFSNLLKGLAGMFRNPTAHNPKITWNITESEALDIMQMLSYCHKKLDKCHRIKL